MTCKDAAHHVGVVFGEHIVGAVAAQVNSPIGEHAADAAILHSWNSLPGVGVTKVIANVCTNPFLREHTGANEPAYLAGAKGRYGPCTTCKG